MKSSMTAAVDADELQRRLAGICFVPRPDLTDWAVSEGGVHDFESRMVK